jgi:hypothetical protein
MDSGVRAKYEALGPEQRLRVDAILASEVAYGWVPKASDIEAVIALVVRPRRPVDGE